MKGISIMSELWRKKGVLISFVLSMVFCGFIQYLETKSPNLFLQTFYSIFYFWIPGLVGIYFAKKEKFRIPIFPKFSYKILFIPFIGLFTLYVCFFSTLPFMKEPFFRQTIFGANPHLPFLTKVLILSIQYVSLLIAYFAGLIGGEIYWRGYLWEKLRNNPLKANLLIGFFWSIWSLPLILFLPYDGQIPRLHLILLAIVFNFSFTPILLYTRVLTNSIFVPALIYAVFQSMYGVTRLFFPSGIKFVYEVTNISLLILFIWIPFFLLKLHKARTWKQLK